MKRIVPALFLLLFGCDVTEPDFEYREYPVIGDARVREITPPDSNYFFVVVSAYVQAKEGGRDPVFRFTSWWQDEHGTERKEERTVPAYGYGSVRITDRNVSYLADSLRYMPQGNMFVCTVVRLDHPSRHLRYELSLLVHPPR